MIGMVSGMMLLHSYRIKQKKLGLVGKVMTRLFVDVLYKMEQTSAMEKICKLNVKNYPPHWVYRKV